MKFRLVAFVVLAGALGLFVGCAGDAGSRGPTAAEFASANAQADADHVPASFRDSYVRLLTTGERDYVVEAMRLGLAAARMGENRLAARVFDSAIRRVATLEEGAAQADRAKSKFVADEEKWFKGETYERSALYLYRGLLYLQAGDYGNAAACAKRVQIEDIATHEQDQGDWYSAEWLLAWASLLQGDQGTAHDALTRAVDFMGRQGTVPPPDRNWNVLVIAEAGGGPVKTRQGEYGEMLYFVEGECRTFRIRAAADPVAGSSPSSQTVAAAENVYFQASRRGGRKLDHILAGKAVFKSATDVAGDAAIVAGAGTALTSDNQTQSLVGLGMIVGGIVTKVISSASHPEADVRSWDNLPHSIFLTGLRCPPGVSTVKVEALSESGAVLATETRTVTISSQNNQNPQATVWLKLP